MQHSTPAIHVVCAPSAHSMLDRRRCHSRRGTQLEGCKGSITSQACRSKLTHMWHRWAAVGLSCVGISHTHTTIGSRPCRLHAQQLRPSQRHFFTSCKLQGSEAPVD